MRAPTGAGRQILDSSAYLAGSALLACVLALAGIGIGVAIIVGGLGRSSPDAGAPAAVQVSTSPPAPVPVAESTAPVPDTSSPAPAGPVTVGPSAGGYSETNSVVSFLDEYFNAINNLDYQSYDALMASGSQDSQASFDQGYGSTSDSAETLINIYQGPGSEYIAKVTFTSHQDASDSVDDSSCDDWDIYLYLQPDGNSYLAEKPPASYQPSYTSCG
jgi:hypothetical protein